VFKGLVANWPSLRDAKNQWSDDNYLRLKELGRDIPVRLEAGRNYMSSKTSVHNVELSAFVESLQQPLPSEPKVAVVDLKECRLFVAQQSIFDIPGMKEDVTPFPAIIKTGKASLYGANLWLCASTGSESPCHFDPYQNILCQVIGTKNVILFPPEQNVNLYPALGTIQKNTSLVDFENPDYNQHPLFQQAEGYHAALQSGDAIFIPRGWWHYISATGISCSVNFWWL
jgi:lysine-specific demethylase 8